MEGSREGRKAEKECKVLRLGAGGGNNNSGRFFADALFIWSQPSGQVCKHEPSVEGGKLFANVGKRVGGRDAVHKELCRGRVQLDGGGARNKVEELRNFAVKQGSFHHFHGSDEGVVCSIAFDTLYEGSCKGSIDAVPDGDG